MVITGKRFGIGVLTLAFVLGVFFIAQSVKILNEMDYSEAGIPLWKGPWEDVPERYRVYLKLDGKLSSIEYPDWGYGSEAFSEYSDAMVFETTNSEDNQVPKEVYFWDYEGKTGLIPAYSTAGDFTVGDATFMKWVQALCEGWVIEVEGYAFDIMQGGIRLTFFDVEKLVSTQKSESLFMYGEVYASSIAGGVVGGSNPSLPVRFRVGRTYRDAYWTDSEYYYGLWMDEGETLRVYFESDRPIRFRLMYSNRTSFMRWRPDHVLVEEPSIMTYDSYFTAEWDGFYIFGFEGGDPASRVAFNALRKTGEVVSIPAWIMGGKFLGGGSGIRIPVNESDLSQFPHLLEAFEARARMTYCPASEAVRILKFFGDKYSKGIDWYGFKLVLEDGTMYHFGLTFGWIPLPVL